VALPTDLPALNIDGALMMQVFMNLLENAAKHTPSGTAITVSALREDGFVRIDVEDEGPGLPAGDPTRLFLKFQRGQEESNTGGAGLGLSICRAIVNAHGGHIGASTKPSGGARFSVTLPITRESAAPMPP
jgi:two-component system sensor histidine kinase KdpD